MAARYKSGDLGIWDNVRDRRVLVGGDGWYDFTAWLAGGNAPDPWNSPPQDPSADELAARAFNAATEDARAALKADALVQALKNRTPAQVYNWIDANVNSLADAKGILKTYGAILCWIIRGRL